MVTDQTLEHHAPLGNMVERQKQNLEMLWGNCAAFGQSQMSSMRCFPDPLLHLLRSEEPWEELFSHQPPTLRHFLVQTLSVSTSSLCHFLLCRVAFVCACSQGTLEFLEQVFCASFFLSFGVSLQMPRDNCLCCFLKQSSSLLLLLHFTHINYSA